VDFKTDPNFHQNNWTLCYDCTNRTVMSDIYFLCFPCTFGTFGCRPSARYTFTINNSGGDGLIGVNDWGNYPFYSVTVNGVTTLLLKKMELGCPFHTSKPTASPSSFTQCCRPFLPDQPLVPHLPNQPLVPLQE
jgi:hypothetical protein